MEHFSPWRKSSFTQEDECVELRWRKSTRSASSGACVEAAHDVVCSGVQVRDSKDREGPRIALPTATFTGLLTFARG